MLLLFCISDEKLQIPQLLSAQFHRTYRKWLGKAKKNESVWAKNGVIRVFP